MGEINTEQADNTRIPYLDILRIIATFAVVLIHVASANWATENPMSLNWIVCNCYDCISRWCVPAFVMISGALFLSRESSIEKILSKNVLRIVTAFVFWSVLYGLLRVLIYGKDLKFAIGEMIVGHYHLWFLFMIAGLYLAVPLLKKITESEKLTKYFLLLSFIFAFVIPRAIKYVSFFNESIADTMNKIVENIDLNMVIGFTGYFVLGYYLSKTDFSKKQRKIIYLIGAAGFAASIVLSTAVSIIKEEPIEIYGDYFSVFVLFESIGIFSLFRYGRTKFSPKGEKHMETLSKYSFGVYLVHPLFLELLLIKAKVDILIVNPIISIPLVTVLITAVSLLASALINNIPKLNKYIV